MFPKEKLDGKQSDFCSKNCAMLLFARGVSVSSMIIETADSVAYAAPVIVAVPKTHTAWENGEDLPSKY